MTLDFYVKFECKRSNRILSVDTKYSMCDLICDVISHCAQGRNIREICVYDKIVFENLKKYKS